MTDEVLDNIRMNLHFTDITDKDIEEAIGVAQNAGYADDCGWSNNPSELIGFINGYFYCLNNNL